MSNVASRLVFLKNLQKLTNRIHATSNIDEIMLSLSQEICNLFAADRLTLYVVAEDGQHIVSKVKTGLNSFRDIRLPISAQSIAGHVAVHRQTLNIADVYDEAALRGCGSEIHFLNEVDRRTGYRSKQMLVVPIVTEAGELLGVLQLINHKGDQPFSATAEEGAEELAQTLAVAFQQRRNPPFVALTRYDHLVGDGILAAPELDLARQSARRKGVTLEEVLVKDFKLTPAMIGQSLARFFGVPYEPFRPDRIKPIDLLRNIKREYVDESHWLPLEDTPEGVLVMTPDPEKLRTSRVVENIFPKRTVLYRVTTQREFAATVDHYFGSFSGGGSVDELLSGMDEPEAATESSDDVSAAADNELVRLVNKIIVDAFQQGASDIHIEPRPGKEKTVVRFRKDGTLVNYIEVPAAYRAPLITRLKIMCDLDISEKRRPQDGKIKFKKYGPLDIELRVATIPTAGGVEDVVMRILAAGEPIRLDQLGLSPRNHENLLKCIEKPYGLFFVCGPTGSGKTTTLHSVLGHLNTPDTKIWTAEDPVEITQKGLRQVQVNKKAGLDFATVMKAFLRADPDIIMVGEMRDPETTGIGIEASLTGHLVFATLHTNSAPESVIRLLDMGMDPFNFADALLGILAQRLGKRLCKECREAYTPDAGEIEHLLDEYCDELRHTAHWQRDPVAAREAIRNEWLSRHASPDGRFTLHRARGCPACNDSGYKGRVGLHELLVGSDPVKRLIQEKARVAEILACALNEGMRTLKMDGIEKVLQGITDLKQVRSVCIK
ncbi:secretion system protein E [Azonexus hydrophilus]|uniref:Secretion system protein E n=1 Tax=Azonexus hydrophilus TaxID=418702 RepID=A0A1R1IDI9_9RHOO|nr:GspE/PulE family protein [Azonexus hydrophilus]OMG56754.1 secretion system protein E [Azonexus hydrophilus]